MQEDRENKLQKLKMTKCRKMKHANCCTAEKTTARNKNGRQRNMNPQLCTWTRKTGRRRMRGEGHDHDPTAERGEERERHIDKCIMSLPFRVRV
mmetsp:Transcript_30996/g.61126  ORF Transcript_30996/g.61126 Transcript_30996/m.61126 type:complete len:94 (-) Transcript_30996:401-682(-)